MASASSLLSEEQFLCSICLDVFTDPITTPCGHNYCNTCISQHWDSSEVCQCPLCQESFHPRPKFSVNKVLAEMADQFRKLKQLKQTSNMSQEPAGPDEVSCDVCTETKLKAVKSCLVCLISYCQTHLEPHQRITALKRHKLINPVKNLEDVICKKHDRPLEKFCKTDLMCVCQFCTETDHKFHKIVSLEEECAGRKTELGKTEAEIQKMIQKRQLNIKEVQHSIEQSRKDADRDKAECVQVFTALISCFERRQAEVIEKIEKEHQQTEERGEGFIRDLQQEITKLEKRSSELKQLSHTEDHLHLLQNFTSINSLPPTKDWTMVLTEDWTEQSSYVETMKTTMADLKKSIICELDRNLYDFKLRTDQEYAVDVTLDPDTAHCKLFLSNDGKQINDRSTAGGRTLFLGNEDRFSSHVAVLGEQGFSSGRFYYEVQVTGKTTWSLGVVGKSINRKESITLSPANVCWTIMLTSKRNKYKVAADKPFHLSVKKEIQKLGVFVDYGEGLVSFYDVENRVHLYSFPGCTFTEELYPFFSRYYNQSGRYDPLILL